VLERAALLSEDGIIRETSLEFESLTRKQVSQVPDALNVTLAEMEKLHISRTLEFERGNVPRTAERLGVPRSSLYAKIRLYGLSSQSERARPAQISH
jgi:transcriptional regulator of acetoin/glycerol metabolism